MSMKYFIGFLIPIIIMMGCKKEQVIETQLLTVSIDPDLQPYFDRFAAEGAERGQQIDLAAAYISGTLENLSEAQALGQCQKYANGSREVRVDLAFWEKAGNMEREFVVFHELGHCFLDRDHLDEANAAGNCISIMNSGKTQCKFNYNSRNREAYLDELFQ